MVDAIDGLPTDLTHDLFEGIVPEITLVVLQEMVHAIDGFLYN